MVSNLAASGYHYRLRASQINKESESQLVWQQDAIPDFA